MKVRTAKLAALGSAATLALFTMGASPAVAAVPDQELVEQHCFVHTYPDGSQSESVCAPTEAALDQLALDDYNFVLLRGGIYDQDDLDAAQAQIDAEYASRGGVTPTAVVILGQIWFGASYTGSSFSATSPYPCSNPFAQAYYSNLHSFGGVADNAESSKTYGGCYMRLWENTSKGGTLFGPTNYNVPSMGTFNDKASSMCVAASSTC